MIAPAEPTPTEEPPRVPAWVYRMDVEPPARHEAWHRAIRVLLVRRNPTMRRRRPG